MDGSFTRPSERAKSTARAAWLVHGWALARIEFADSSMRVSLISDCLLINFTPIRGRPPTGEAIGADGPIDFSSELELINDGSLIKSLISDRSLIKPRPGGRRGTGRVFGITLPLPTRADGPHAAAPSPGLATPLADP